MNLTKEQQLIVDHVKTYPSEFTCVNSVAGSGKTSLLTAIAEELQPTRALYLAYNKSIATEASRKFPKAVLCSTIHSFAYRATVPEYGLKIGNLTYRQLPPTIPYETRLLLIEILRSYFLSSFLYLEEFCESIAYDNKEYIKEMNKILAQLESLEIDCSHEYYLKMFHILLASKHLEYEPFDFIALDEAGDINPVTLEIVKLLPAKTKILVGDSRQNIYGFNHTINCFAYNLGQNFTMSKSFRVSETIAKQVSKFCNRYIDPTMSFVGSKQDTSIESSAYITRTNAYLISKMMELNELGVPYTLIRSADDIFKLANCVSTLSVNTKFVPSEYNFLMDDIKDFKEHKKENPGPQTLIQYLNDMYKDNVVMTSTIRLVQQYRRDGIATCYSEAKKRERLKTNYYLGTAHSFKGLEVDEVFIADDLNSVVGTVQVRSYYADYNFDALSKSDQGELNLYYVACTRAKKKLLNATQLDHIPEIPAFEGE